MRRTVYRKLAFHSIAPHFLSPEFVSVIVHVIQVVDETAISSNGVGKLHIKILLVRHPCTEFLLSKHLTEGDFVIVSVDSDDVAGFWISRLDLTKY